MTGQQPVVELKSPVDCSREEYDRLRQMVLDAGEVDEAGFDGRIARAEMLAFLRIGTATVGVGALKNPDQGYPEKLFKRANAKNVASPYTLELGWVVVDEAHQGRSLSRLIASELVAGAGGRKLYATSATARIAMHKALSACGFERDGGEWQSRRRPEEKLYLFVHNGHSDKVGARST